MIFFNIWGHPFSHWALVYYTMYTIYVYVFVYVYGYVFLYSSSYDPIKKFQKTKCYFLAGERWEGVTLDSIECFYICLLEIHFKLIERKGEYQWKDAQLSTRVSRYVSLLSINSRSPRSLFAFCLFLGLRTEALVENVALLQSHLGKKCAKLSTKNAQKAHCEQTLK